jgi:hypothetical protein
LKHKDIGTKMNACKASWFGRDYTNSDYLITYVVFWEYNKISIRSDVILSAFDLHDDKTELTSLGGTVMSHPPQHPLILSPTPPAMWGKESGVFSSK